MLEREPSKSVLPTHRSGEIKVDGIKDLIIGYASHHHVIRIVQRSFPAFPHVIQPLGIITLKLFYRVLRQFIVQQIFIDIGLSPLSRKRMAYFRACSYKAVR